MEVHNGSLKKAKTDDSKRHMDFFSELPDPIIEHILSYLPLKDAIQTVLLQRFGELWRGIQVLDFNSCSYNNRDYPNHRRDLFYEKFTNVIRRVLDLHDNSTLDRVSLRFCFRLSYMSEEPQEPYLVNFVEREARASAEIEKLIRYAMSRKVKVLDLDLNGDELVEQWLLYKLPDVMRSDDLTYLYLAAFDMTSCNNIDLKSLKTLVLNNVSLRDKEMKAVLLHCPVLEDLSIARCHRFQVVKCKNPKLKKLQLAFDRNSNPALVFSPYVLSLHLSGSLISIGFMNASSAVDASICICRLLLSLEKQYSKFLFLIEQFAKCKTFSLCTWSIMMMCMWNVPGSRPSFQWESLTLKLGLTKWHLAGLSALFRNSPSLETLSMYIYPGYHDRFKRKVPWWIKHLAGGENFWDSQEAMLPCLKTIAVFGHVDDPYVIEMVGFLLKQATSLQKLVVSANQSLRGTCKYWHVGEDDADSPQYSAVQLHELTRKLGSLPRASREAIIHFC